MAANGSSSPVLRSRATTWMIVIAAITVNAPECGRRGGTAGAAGGSDHSASDDDDRRRSWEPGAGRSRVLVATREGYATARVEPDS